MSLTLTVPKTYAELEAAVKRWIATCVMSRTRVDGAPAHREEELVNGNLSLVRLWDTVLKSMVGQQAKILAEYKWGREGTEWVRFAMPTTYINIEPEIIEVPRPVPPPKPVRKPDPDPRRRKPDPHDDDKRKPPPPPPPPRKPDAPKPPNIDDFRNQPNQLPPKSSKSWGWELISAAAAALGMVVSVGVRALTAEELELAIEGAWVAFQIGFQAETGGLAGVVGLAGEFAAEAVLPRLLGLAPESVFGLNLIAENAPVFDLLAPTEATSAKVFGVLSNPARVAVSEALKSDYKQAAAELLGLDRPVRGTTKLQKAVDFIWNNRPSVGDIPKEAFPKGIRSAAQLETFLKEHGRIRVLDDHVTIARRAMGELLAERMGDPAHLTAADAVRINDITRQKVAGLGISSKDLQQMLEASKKLPAKYTSHMQAKAEAWRRRIQRLKKR